MKISLNYKPSLNIISATTAKIKKEPKSCMYRIIIQSKQDFDDRIEHKAAMAETDSLLSLQLLQLHSLSKHPET